MIIQRIRNYHPVMIMLPSVEVNGTFGYLRLKPCRRVDLHFDHNEEVVQYHRGGLPYDLRLCRELCPNVRARNYDHNYYSIRSSVANLTIHVLDNLLHQRRGSDPYASSNLSNNSSANPWAFFLGLQRHIDLIIQRRIIGRCLWDRWRSMLWRHHLLWSWTWCLRLDQQWHHWRCLCSCSWYDYINIQTTFLTQDRHDGGAVQR